MAKIGEKQVGFVHGSGAWSQTKFLYLRTSANVSSFEKNSKVERLRKLFINLRDGWSRNSSRTSVSRFWRGGRVEGELQQDGQGHDQVEGDFGECSGRLVERKA